MDVNIHKRAALQQTPGKAIGVLNADQDRREGLFLTSENQQFSDASEYAPEPRIPCAKELVGIREESIGCHLSEQPVLRLGETKTFGKATDKR
jgi:hypothetical protein